MGEEGILMCFAFFSDTKVGMHRTSGSFTSQIAMRYRTFRTLGGPGYGPGGYSNKYDTIYYRSLSDLCK